MTEIAVLAAVAPPASPVGPGLLGFLVVAAIGVALYLLVKSMNRQISKIEVPREEDLVKREASERKSEPGEGPESGQAGEGTR
ncbi:hypothetical protein Ssi03_40140 [Sphaerisporangium siamense]|uniref:Uncharacterized protein n=1 Tax=Sphaerisporangium siamense TaxID=795645 RepID=A0A7W7D5S9_9ACTN|nr:hypothetical protein [Sphaerisporangium siamense]MBB4700830.1 hypothetical protein [Sphaerisporangium siamense]GII86024.1 hypothetical protein Ssi03_40140 [Sphaerisporangium siamense]